jgi:hypothetical protein
MFAREHKFYFLDLLQNEHLTNEDESKEIDATRKIYPFEAICTLQIRDPNPVLTVNAVFLSRQ